MKEEPQYPLSKLISSHLLSPDFWGEERLGGRQLPSLLDETLSG